MYPIPANRIIVPIPSDPGSVPEIWIPQAISYSFQVVEYRDKDNNLIKSRLEVCRNFHDQYGSITHSESFTEVPRITRPI